jgi:hypothetical protein
MKVTSALRRRLGMKAIPGDVPESMLKKRLEQLNEEYDKVRNNDAIPANLKVRELASLKKEINRVEKEYMKTVTNKSVDASDSE